MLPFDSLPLVGPTFTGTAVATHTSGTLYEGGAPFAQPGHEKRWELGGHTREVSYLTEADVRRIVQEATKPLEDALVEITKTATELAKLVERLAR